MGRLNKNYINSKVVQRFEGKFFKDVDTDCWNWNAGKTGKGYGQFKLKGKYVQAHRFSYLYYVGEYPEYLHVLHTCDNPLCVNPDHLFLGTNTSNMQDKVLKSRCNHKSGEKHHKAKLTMHQVRRIREFASVEVSYRELSNLFSVDTSTIRRIVENKRYKEVNS